MDGMYVLMHQVVFVVVRMDEMYVLMQQIVLVVV